MTGPGTDLRDPSPGAGLLEHDRALLAWLDRVQARHPALLVENCASGAMRMDYAMLQRLHLQSTSDQQDPLQYASIAAAAPASLLPEQAGHWAYPERGMNDELLVLSLVNGVLGRMYLSGYLNRMSDAQRATITAAVAAHREVLASIERSRPVWPLGLPGWDDPWIAVGLATAEALHLTVWELSGAGGAQVLPLPGFSGRTVHIDPVFPRDRGGWTWSWDATSGLLTVAVEVGVPSARVVRITAG
jgi:alpha-galactosidase